MVFTIITLKNMENDVQSVASGDRRRNKIRLRRFFSAKFYDIVEVCWPALIKSSVHHGGNLEFNSCHRSEDAYSAGLMCAR